MEKELIINVGRQIGSGGRIIAKMLADEFEVLHQHMKLSLHKSVLLESLLLLIRHY